MSKKQKNQRENAIRVLRRRLVFGLCGYSCASMRLGLINLVAFLHARFDFRGIRFLRIDSNKYRQQKTNVFRFLAHFVENPLRNRIFQWNNWLEPIKYVFPKKKKQFSLHGVRRSSVVPYLVSLFFLHSMEIIVEYTCLHLLSIHLPDRLVHTHVRVFSFTFNEKTIQHLLPWIFFLPQYTRVRMRMRI